MNSHEEYEFLQCMNSYYDVNSSEYMNSHNNMNSSDYMNSHVPLCVYVPDKEFDCLTDSHIKLNNGNCHELPYSSYEPVILEKD